MSNKKQTAVELLVKELNKIIDFIPMDKWDKIRDIVQQAKEMDKQQKIEAYNQGYRDGENDASNTPLSIGDIEEYSNAEQYYKETYEDNN